MERFDALQQLVPELEELLERRYNLLRVIRESAPAGRRSIAARLDSSERVVRSEIDLLRAQGLVNCSAAGYGCRPGEEVLYKVQSFVRQLHDLAYLEKVLAPVLGVSRLIIVPGDADDNPNGQADLAMAAARFLYETLGDGDVLGVTGELPWLRWPNHLQCLTGKGRLLLYRSGEAWARM